MVTTSLFVNSISAVSERNMVCLSLGRYGQRCALKLLLFRLFKEYVVQFRFQQEWLDDRLAYSRLGDERSFAHLFVARDQTIWIPDRSWHGPLEKH